MEGKLHVDSGYATQSGMLHVEGGHATWSNRSKNDWTLPSITFPHETQDFTNSIPSKQEIWETLKSMKKNASPGPDGFNVGFYLAAWSWIGDDVTTLINNFYLTGILPAHLNDTHIALIPKKNGLPFTL